MADSALRSAGAKTASDYGDVTPNANYIWGTTVVHLSSVRPGDILQFRNFICATKTTFKTATEEKWETKTETLPHHTAIVEKILPDGSELVLEQNVDPGGKIVQEAKLFLRSTYVKNTRTVESTTTTMELNWKGTVKAYRPQNKHIPIHTPKRH